jgi:DNA-directed RNA polymerase subunit omega
MARVTVEDCIEKVNNRFALVLMAAQRAISIARGAQASVAKDNDKPTIIALREIAEEAISISGLYVLTKNRIVDDSEAQDDSDEAEVIVKGEDGSDEDSTLGELDEEDLAALMDMDAVLEEDGDDEDSDADVDIDIDIETEEE